jgi:aromatic ring-opening dioxygenase catalytic subunit (LigB family)
MAEIVGAFGVPHNPHFPSLVEANAPQAAEIRSLYGGVTRQLHAANADTILYITSDHYNIFFETCVPIFGIGVAESARGASDYPTLPARELSIDSELAGELHRSLVEAGFDVGMMQEFEFDHTVIAPMWFLAPTEDIPLVPLFVNGLIPPLPTARRCFALGAAIRTAIERSASVRRVAVVASGSFSLEIGGPRISEDSHTGVPAPEWLERILELLRLGQVEQLVDEATGEQLAHAGNAGGELLDWITMLAMFDPAPPAFLESQPQFGHAFAAWSIPAQ